MKIELFEYLIIKPLEWFEIYDPSILINLDTLIFTWLAMVIIFSIILFSRRYLYRPENPVSLIFEQSIETFYNLCVDTFGYFRYGYFSFITTLFIFTLVCNMVALLPYIEEPTKDLHTALALGIISFCYVQYQKIRVKGIKGYLKEFIEPIFIMLPLNIIGELAKVLSMSFRLFGNILGGAIVLMMAIGALEPYRKTFIIYALVVLASYLIAKKLINLDQHSIIRNIFNVLLAILFALSFVQMFFVIFEGFIQAFVITMLTMTYLAVGASEQQEEKLGENA